jgi:hypothetical protein
MLPCSTSPVAISAHSHSASVLHVTWQRRSLRNLCRLRPQRTARKVRPGIHQGVHPCRTEAISSPPMYVSSFFRDLANQQPSFPLIQRSLCSYSYSTIQFPRRSHPSFRPIQSSQSGMGDDERWTVVDESFTEDNHATSRDGDLPSRVSLLREALTVRNIRKQH